MKEEQNNSAIVLENCLKEYKKAKENNKEIPDNFITFIKEKRKSKVKTRKLKKLLKKRKLIH